MKIGIYYYSRTGNTRHAARLLQEKLKERQADVKLVEIQTVKKTGFLKAGYSALRQKGLPIRNKDLDLQQYDRVLFGCPVWAGKPAPVIKTFCNQSKHSKGKKIGLFVTNGSQSSSQTEVAALMNQYAQAQGFIAIDAFLSLQMMTEEIKDGTQILPHFLDKLLEQ